MNMHIIAYCRKQMQFANRRLQRYNLELMNNDINFMGNGIRLVIIVIWPTFPSFTEKKVAQQSWWSAKWESWDGIYNITFCMELQKQTSILSDKFDHCTSQYQSHLKWGRTSERTWTLVRGGSGGWEWRSKLSHQVEWQVPIQIVNVVLSLTSERLPTAEGT